MMKVSVASEYTYTENICCLALQGQTIWQEQVSVTQVPGKVTGLEVCIGISRKSICTLHSIMFRITISLVISCQFCIIDEVRQAGTGLSISKSSFTFTFEVLSDGVAFNVCLAVRLLLYTSICAYPRSFCVYSTQLQVL